MRLSEVVEGQVKPLTDGKKTVVRTRSVEVRASLPNEGTN